MRNEIKELKAPLLKLVNKINPTKLYVAYSGGVDSTVLLHILADLKNKNQIIPSLQAIHINHNLQQNAGKWAKHCQDKCLELGADFKLVRVQVDTMRPSLESEARQARFAAFAKELGKNSALLMAQHRDDQVETFFLRLVRGAGPHGLAAMRPIRKLHKGVLLRPWLEVPKNTIIKYAKEHGIDWVEDDSNLDRSIDRNFLRLEVIPRLKERWPGLGKTVSRSARLLAETSKASYRLKPRLKVKKLAKLKSAAAGDMVYQWLRYLGAPMPSHKKIQNIVKEVALARKDARAYVSWRGGEVRRYAGKLYYFRQKQSLEKNNQSKTLSGKDIIAIANNGVVEFAKSALYVTMAQSRGLLIEEHDEITIKFAQGGEKIKPVFGKHTKKLKKIWQEQQIPPWERRKIPLIFINGKLAQVVGICTEGALTANQDSTESGISFSMDKKCRR